MKKKCGNCDNELQGKNWKGKSFCSLRCSFDFKTDEFIAAWKTGEVGGSQKGGELRNRIKLYLLREAEYKCTGCGWGEVNPVLGRPILTIDHIDGNWKNNTPENLVVLCYNCHSLTPTFGALNREAVGGRRQGFRSWRVDEFKCLGCEARVSKTSTRCVKCSNRLKNVEKIDWPSNEELLDRLSKTTYTGLARELGVSDNAIRARLRRSLAS